MNFSEEKLKEIFFKADASRDGIVNIFELKNLIITEFGSGATDRQLAHMIADLDRDGDKQISWDEFKTAMMTKQRRRNDFSEKFRELDKDCSNTLTKEEIKQLFEKSGCSEEEIAAVFSRIDTNQDDIVSFEEFMAML